MQETPRYSEEHLVGYLLGELDEVDRDKLEDEALADDELAERIDMALTDLLDAHAAQRLPPERARVLEARIARSPDTRSRFQFALELRERALAAAPRPRRWRDALGPLFAAAVVALAVAAVVRAYLPAGGMATVAAIELAPAERGRADVPVLTLPNRSGVVEIRLTSPAIALGRRYIVHVAPAEGGETSLSTEASRRGSLHVRVAASALGSSRITVTVSPEESPRETVAFFELRVARGAL